MAEGWLVVGLGNPGPAYAGNRHNVGQLVVDELGVRFGARFRAHKAGADVIEGRLGSKQVVLAKPRSFMNESGRPVSALCSFFGFEVSRLLVVHDELDLDFGVLRLKAGGGDGGHNGLRSITQALRGPDYSRVRVGIGRPPGRMEPATFVLRDFSSAERGELGAVVGRAADACESVVEDGLEAAQNTYNVIP